MSQTFHHQSKWRRPCLCEVGVILYWQVSHSLRPWPFWLLWPHNQTFVFVLNMGTTPQSWREQLTPAERPFFETTIQVGSGQVEKSRDLFTRTWSTTRFKVKALKTEKQRQLFTHTDHVSLARGRLKCQAQRSESQEKWIGFPWIVCMGDLRWRSRRVLQNC